jgi:hypothetical protein
MSQFSTSSAVKIAIGSAVALSLIASTMMDESLTKLEDGNVKPFIDWGTATRADFLALNYSPKYLPRDRLRDGFVYLIHAPKNYIGIWSAEKRSF